VIWQVVPAGIVPFVNVMVVAPVSAVNSEDVPQLFVVAGDELLTVTFAGRVSVIEKFVRLVSAGAVMLMRKREFSPARMVAGENDLLADIPAPSAYTVTFADAPSPLVTP
jgi:hypothetical protein